MESAINTKRNSISVVRLGKLLIFVLLLYISWFKEVFGDTPIILYGCSILMTALAVIECVLKKHALNNMPYILTAFFIYAAYSVVTGAFVAKNFSVFVSSMVTFVAFAVVCFDIWVVAESEGQMDWLLNILIICGIICAVQTVFFGVDYYNELIVRTMSKKNNPNTLGIIMITAIVSIITRPKLVSERFGLSAALVLLFSYVIILSGSRKCFAAVIILLLFFAYAYLRNLYREDPSKTKNTILFVLILIVVGFYAYRYLSDTVLFRRLKSFTSDEANIIRIRLLHDAVQFWKERPIIGIGFGQYAEWSLIGRHSHATYAEVLSCSGIIGIVIFFLPFVMLIRQLALSEKPLKTEHGLKYKHTVLRGALLAELFLGVGQIFVYSLIHMVLLTFIFYESRKVSSKTWG